MKLHVGQAALRGDISRYARRFDLLELRAEPGKLPRPKQLRQWSERVPERFVFSVMLPRIVGTLDAQPGFDDALAQSLASAEALSARWIVLQTPHSVMPSSRTRRRLRELFERLPREQRRLGWEPRGVWEEEEAEELAQELEVCLVRDLTRLPPPPGDAAYTRVLALGENTRVRAGAVERLSENLADFAEAFVVIEGEGAPRAAILLRELVGSTEFAGEEGEADDDEFPEDDLEQDGADEVEDDEDDT
jgi:uncharacterized protein YecE (DUF72 family)